ncbi:hypothetical protein IU474_11835 [Nocardia otitidiscaviarum]|uniref:hypothetical protein n=1 Tax=Nocardia otitidiscaviarum TaxID=1823 RepID=UPI0018955B5B|nr:hypothetical protein [Nocardia otitidiscaviarum]MBF6237757.1 hypothetical protein [Nocardia otitidiscaviarum]
MIGRRARRTEPAAEDFGLLFAIATVATEAAAGSVRALLRANDIRATTATARRSDRPCWRVLVFPEDAVRAYHVLCAQTG